TRWRLLCTASNSIEAALVQGRLESAGIPVQRSGEAVAEVYGLTFGDLARVRIFVPERWLAEARRRREAPAGDDGADPGDPAGGAGGDDGPDDGHVPRWRRPEGSISRDARHRPSLIVPHCTARTNRARAGSVPSRPGKPPGRSDATTPGVIPDTPVPYA